MNTYLSVSCFRFSADHLSALFRVTRNLVLEIKNTGRDGLWSGGLQRNNRKFKGLDLDLSIMFIYSLPYRTKVHMALSRVTYTLNFVSSLFLVHLACYSCLRVVYSRKHASGQLLIYLLILHIRRRQLLKGGLKLFPVLNFYELSPCKI